MGKKINVAGELNAATEESIVADSKQVRELNKGTVQAAVTFILQKLLTFAPICTANDGKQYVMVNGAWVEVSIPHTAEDILAYNSGEETVAKRLEIHDDMLDGILESITSISVGESLTQSLAKGTLFWVIASNNIHTLFRITTDVTASAGSPVDYDDIPKESVTLESLINECAHVVNLASMEVGPYFPHPTGLAQSFAAGTIVSHNNRLYILNTDAVPTATLSENPFENFDTSPVTLDMLLSGVNYGTILSADIPYRTTVENEGLENEVTTNNSLTDPITKSNSDNGLLPRNGSHYQLGSISSLLFSREMDAMTLGATFIFTASSDFTIGLPIARTVNDVQLHPNHMAYIVNADKLECESGETYLLTITCAGATASGNFVNLFNLQQLTQASAASNNEE